MRLFSYLAACGAAAIMLPAHADPGDTWTYEASPYLHAAGLHGTAGAGRVSAPVDLSFDDVLNHLDLALQGAFVARRGPLSYGLDAEYFRLSDDGARSVTGPRGRATVQGSLDATSTLGILEAIGGYRVLDEQTKVDLVAGVRMTWLYDYLDLHGSLTVGDEVFGRSRALSGSRVWADGVVGARVLHTLNDQVTLFGYAEVGTGDSSFTWQALLGVNWKVARDYDVRFGYRELAWNYSRSGVLWDMKLRGPYVGLGIHF